jgi:hypothetical protein
MVNFNELPKAPDFGVPPERSTTETPTENSRPAGGEQSPSSAPFGGFGRKDGAK